MKWLLTFILFQFSYPLCAQSLSGKWEGNFPPHSFSVDTRQLIVILNVEDNGAVSGTSYLDYGGGYFEHYRLAGRYQPKLGLLIIKEYLTIGVKLPPGSFNRLGTYYLKLEKSEDIERFEGEWRDNKPGDLMAIKSTPVYFLRYTPKLPAVEPKKTAPEKEAVAQPKKVTRPKAPLLRTTDVQRTIALAGQEGDSVLVELFDNGEDDGDRVSLYLDNVRLFHNTRISEQPLEFRFSLDKKNPKRIIRLVAEHLGSTPPCTAYARITTSRKQIGVNLSSEFSKNGTIVFVLQPD